MSRQYSLETNEVQVNNQSVICGNFVKCYNREDNPINSKFSIESVSPVTNFLLFNGKRCGIENNTNKLKCIGNIDKEIEFNSIDTTGSFFSLSHTDEKGKTFYCGRNSNTEDKNIYCNLAKENVKFKLIN